MPGNLQVNLKTTSAPPVRVDDLTVVPELQSLVVQLPFGGFVWSRPTAVVVEHAGRAHRSAVWDVTRLAQLGLLGIALAAMVIAAANYLIQGRSAHEH